MDLITMMECENGKRDIKIRGDGGYSVGICQIHTRYHRLPAEYYTSRKTQVELCNQKRKN
nr:MAG TPA: lysozyme [Caudoviricetes sp.]